ERSILLFFAAGTAPVFEELVFRGVLWPAARDRGFRVSGYLLVSAGFALIHGNVAAFVPLAGLGMFWTWLYEKTGDLSAPILSHALFNLTNFLWILSLPPDAPTAP
ncbi:MAG: CPBP family intramembrane metalloprotease, partial [Verrucomicrobiales bacterium]|nr:CPBP family intramembrane metalloprotease [Verrucomicrobiales bacterium]